MCFFRRRRLKKKELQEEQVVMQQEAQKVEKGPAKEAKPVEKPAKEEQPEKPAVNPKYHVSQNKDAKSEHHKKWRVRKEGSNKTIKYFDTQAEAIVFAEDLAEKNDTSIVIHKLDGSIRKQDYTKK